IDVFAPCTTQDQKLHILALSKPSDFKIINSDFSMTTSLIQILDDNHGDFKYGGAGKWTLNQQAAWYLGTTTFPAFVSPGEALYGTFVLTFEGISIAFTGNTVTPDYSQVATVSIDGGTPYNISYPDTPLQTYVQWYQSPTLPEGTHTIVVEHLDGTAVDYALIQVGPNTPLNGKTLVIDNDDEAIRYSGQWQRNTDQFESGNLPNGFPLRNSTHRSSRPGDNFTFSFVGTSVAVYGIVDWQELGILSIAYILDGTPLNQSYPFTTSTPEYASQDKERSNFLYFSLDGLSAGSHTLTVKVTESQNSQYVFDYATYTPSFSSLGNMPGAASSALSSPASVSTYATFSNSDAVPLASNSGAAGDSTSSISSINSRTIAAGAVSGMVFLVLSITTLFLMRRRRLRKLSTVALPSAIPFPLVDPLAATLNRSRSGHIADLKRLRSTPPSTNNGVPPGSTSTSDMHRQMEPPDYDESNRIFIGGCP
ncbi:hypothetical protein CVT26_014852, partial [Gymnopilus dilepis]